MKESLKVSEGKDDFSKVTLYQNEEQRKKEVQMRYNDESICTENSRISKRTDRKKKRKGIFVASSP